MADEANSQQDMQQAVKNSTSTVMHVKVYAPFHTYFDGSAESVTAENETGVFDVLAHHKNFLTLLSPCEMIIRASGKEEKIKIGGGVMHVKADEVIVFLDV